MISKKLLLIGCAVLLLASCSRGRVRRETVIGKELYQVAMPTGRDVVHPEYGKEEWFGIGPLSGEGKVKANGLAEMHVFEEGVTVVTFQLNIEAPPQGSSYVAWLLKPDGSDALRMDSLGSPFKDVRHFLTMPHNRDLRGFSAVQIRQERNAGPSEGDAVVAKGAITVRTR